MVATAYWSCIKATPGRLITRPSPSLPHESTIRLSRNSPRIRTKIMNRDFNNNRPIIFCCTEFNTSTKSSEEGAIATTLPPSTMVTTNVPMRKARRRYRKLYPGEKEGITEEMRFVAMKLRNSKPKVRNCTDINKSDDADVADNVEAISSSLDEDGNGDCGGGWEPSMEGFLKYLVDSKLVFSTIEQIVDESSDVSYAYFRKTGLERSEGLSKDLEWFSQRDIVIPEPSNPGVTYVEYLEQLAEKSPPLFLSHFYNIYFSHIAGGQVITKQVSKKLLKGRELEFYRWEEDAEELLRGVREKLNMLGEHWTRDEKNKCLREATKSFRFLGQIIRLIIL
ncbi:unnamed protein product [Ilex paraguariensis]|uniref:Inactive heme oxygenase 2, chloroplastic n=1 Tax=Ilex paraguariensis TaxID=185542 RepID=A0ABC8UA40_9AQUA